VAIETEEPSRQHGAYIGKEISAFSISAALVTL
jgi:hypothetical protein